MSTWWWWLSPVALRSFGEPGFKLPNPTPRLGRQKVGGAYEWAMHMKLRRPGEEWLVYVELVKWRRTCVRYSMYMREGEVIRATDIGMVPLGYGRFVRADEILAVLPIDEGRGRGRRTHVHVAGLTAPIVASRSEGAILADMKAASGSSRRGTSSEERRPPRTEQAATGVSPRRSRLGFGARRS
jgi:hypothetical protein